MINNCLCKNSFVLQLMMNILDIPLQVMSKFLSSEEVDELKLLHRIADKKQRDKIKAILLLDRGYAYGEIAKILLIDYITFWRWYENHVTSRIKGLLKDNTATLLTFRSLSFCPVFGDYIN